MIPPHHLTPHRTPRVFIVRHGETEWSLSGKHTGVTDLPLTANGETRVHATGRALVGDDRLIVPGRLVHVYVSPRKRAQRTLELLNLNLPDPYPWQTPDDPVYSGLACPAHVEVTESVREWDYGEYEGITSAEIRQRRETTTHPDSPHRWDIWRDGCPGGESPADIVARLDGVIADIRARWHAPAMGGNGERKQHGDVLVVAHGHILRALALRWCGKALHEGPAFLLEAGGVGILSYEHDNIDEPAILLGGGFTVDLDSGEK